MTLFRRGLVLWVLLTPVRLVAQEPFEHRYAEATEQYRTEHYAEALASFQAAYDIEPLPGILFNMGQACLHLDRPQEALKYYDRYEAAKPDLDPRERQKLDAARAEAKARLAQAVHPTPLLPPAAAAQPALSPALLAPGAARAAVDAQKAPAHKPIYKRWWFWGAVGLVAAGAATGLAIGLTGSAPADPLAGVPHWKPEF